MSENNQHNRCAEWLNNLSKRLRTVKYAAVLASNKEGGVTMGEQWPPNRIGLSAGKRVLFLTKDLGLIRKQLYEGLDL